MGSTSVRRRDMVRLFMKVGATAFGGWSATSLLLEKELVNRYKLLSKQDLESAVAYSQVLPGATQVSIVASAGYKMRGTTGACLATASYLLPGIGLIVTFAVLYFGHPQQSIQYLHQLDGLVAALAGIILANAYRIGRLHADRLVLWIPAGIAFAAKFWLHVNVLLVLASFGAIGLAYSYISSKNVSRGAAK